MKPRYKLDFLVQTVDGKHGVITSVILEKNGVSYRFDGEPTEYAEDKIVASFREIKPRVAKVTKKKAAPARKSSQTSSTAAFQ